MWNIKKELQRAASASQALVNEISPHECAAIRRTVASRFAGGRLEWPTWIWEHFTDARCVHDPNGWRWVGDYIQKAKAIIFFNERDEPSMLEFLDGTQVVPVLADCLGFEFFLTNREVDYVLCYNHHDCLIATGKAKEWLEKRQKGAEKEY